MTAVRPAARYTQGLGIDEPLEVYEGGKSYYYHADGLGSIVALTKSTGTAANTYFGYNTFGGMPSASETVANPFRFTARDYDSETGLYYYRARYYDSLFGRFLSEDPRGLSRGVNLYAYVFNDPTVLVDPRGLGAVPPCVENAYQEFLRCSDQLTKSLEVEKTLEIVGRKITEVPSHPPLPVPDDYIPGDEGLPPTESLPTQVNLDAHLEALTEAWPDCLKRYPLAGLQRMPVNS